MSGGFEVLKAGIQATLQDLGRVGLASIGVSRAGALDEFSFHQANMLLGNKYGTNMVEILFGGVKLKARGSTTFVLSGAEVEAKINDKPIEIWKTYHIYNGDTLELGYASSGVRVYLGVVGGFDMPCEHGSCSVSIKEGLGGEPLYVNQLLPFTCRELKDSRSLIARYRPNYDEVLTMRVVAGYQWDMFETKEREKFFNSSYQVTGHNNRMGYRLSGEKISSTCGGIISEAIAYGSIQIPPDANPIVLLKERQTIGGYPKIGAVVPEDCFRLAQRKQNSIVRFKLIGLDDARDVSREFYKFFTDQPHSSQLIEHLL